MGTMLNELLSQNSPVDILTYGWCIGFFMGAVIGTIATGVMTLRVMNRH